ncbi:MAG: peptidoglycan DD-metalloendopeptidase family protein [Candidatus Paceibacterota bacterium]|jgi:LysM repeat protein
MPTRAQAGFLSSILGDNASAKTATVDPTQFSQTSGTIALLQANISSASVYEDKKLKDVSQKDKGGIVDVDNADNIVSNNALLPATGPMGVYSGKDVVDPSAMETSVYVVRKGDSISAIADMFEVSVNTILWANDMKKSDKIIEGDVLFILPISGIEHTVTKGQTIQSIAKLYKVDVDDITFYNDINEATKLAIGDKLMIPNGNMADEGGDIPSPNLKANEIKDKNYYATSSLKNIIGYFINPLPTGHKTQGLHGPGRRGIDIGAPTGTNIYASAPGIVTAVKTGCKVGQTRCGGGYGNMVIIQHSNGTKTLYAHMSKVITHTGAQVDRGDVVGLVGSTGKSTGPHIHFEIFGAKNPGADWSWAK